MKQLDTFRKLCLVLLLNVASYGFAQIVPQHVTYLYMLNAATGEPLSGCEVRVSCKLSTGEFVNENLNGTIDDIFPTAAYPVGSELEIILTKVGFKRKEVHHVVSMDPLMNRIDVLMAAAASDTIGLLIEGDLYFLVDGIRHPAKGEIVRLFTQNGFRNVPVDQNGYYRITLSETEIAGKDSLKVRAAYANDVFEFQEITIPTHLHYKHASFQLQPKTKTVMFEILVRDSTTGNPLDNAHVRIHQGAQLIAEGSTTEHGYFKADAKLVVRLDSIEIQVFKQGYGTTIKKSPISTAAWTFAIQAQEVTLHGQVKTAREDPFPVEIYLDTVLYKTIMTAEDGKWQLQISRAILQQYETIKVVAIDQGTYGVQKQPTNAILEANSSELPEINPRSKAGKWQNQINFGIGMGMDKSLTTFIPSGEICFGTRYLPGLQLGVGFSHIWLVHFDAIDVFQQTLDTIRSDTLKRRFFSFNLKYYLGPRFLPSIKLMLGSSFAPSNHRIFAGLQFSFGRSMKLELAGCYLFSAWKNVVESTFNYLGPAIPHTIPIWRTNRCLYTLTFIKRISWLRKQN